jgi:ribose-phosphate pyrophosphokinase
MHDQITLIFDATNGQSSLYRAKVATGRFEEGRLTRKVYGDGEVGHFIQPDLKPQDASPSLKGTLTGRKVVVVGDLSTFELAMDTFDVCNAAWDETAWELTLVVPRSSLPEDEFRRQGLLELFLAVPEAPNGNFLVIEDEGSKGTPNYTRVDRVVPSNHTAYDKFGHDAKQVLFYTQSYKYMAEKMLAYSPDQFELGEVEVEDVEGKPFFKKLKTDVRGREVVIVSGTIDARETFEQYHMARAVALEGALTRDVIEAYYGYGTMERKTKSGEAVKGKIRARLISQFPKCSQSNRVVFVDLHADGIPYYLERESGLQPYHVYVFKHLIASAAYDMIEAPGNDWLGTLPLKVPTVRKKKAPVACSTDIGRYKWIDSTGTDTGLDKAYGNKARRGDGDIEFIGAHGQIRGRNTLCGDDKWGTGSTMRKALGGMRLDQYGKRLLAKIKKFGEGSVKRIPNVISVAAVSHLVDKSGDSLRKARVEKDVIGRPLVSRLVTSDSHPWAYAHAQNPEFKGFLWMKSIVPLVCEAVRN